MLGKLTLVAIVVTILLFGMGNYHYLDGPKQAMTVIDVLLGLCWLGGWLIRRKRQGKSAGLPPLKWKNI